MTATLLSTEFLFLVNDDEDPAIYEGLPRMTVPRKDWMNEVLAVGVERVLHGFHQPDIIGFVGDDNRFRTIGWDERISGHLMLQPGLAYGNDLARPDLPTHVFINAAIIRALGFLGLPGAHHLYLDDTWRVLGEEAHCLYYFEDVVIEHLHPFFGKGRMDASYEATNAPEVYAHDREVFTRWIEGPSLRDIAIVRRIAGG